MGIFSWLAGAVMLGISAHSLPRFEPLSVTGSLHAMPRLEPSAATGACACGFGVKTHATEAMQFATGCRRAPFTPKPGHMPQSPRLALSGAIVENHNRMKFSPAWVFGERLAHPYICVATGWGEPPDFWYPSMRGVAPFGGGAATTTGAPKLV